MRARSDRASPILQVQAGYSLRTLARAAGITHQTLLRLLQANGVEVIRGGRSMLVPLTELETHMPLLWRNIVAAERVRADAREAAKRKSNEIKR